MNQPDKFRELFRMQKALNERSDVHADGMDDGAKAKRILNYCLAIRQEVSDLTDSVLWKWRARYQKYNEQNLRVEIVDILHFLISLARVAGMSAGDVFQARCKKNEVYLKRQEFGYHAKDESDSGLILL